MMMRVVVIGFFSAILVFQNTLFARVSNQDVPLIIITNFLLNSELPPEPEITPPILIDIEGPIEIMIDGSHQSILFPNSSVDPLLGCSIIPDLPDGLSLQLVDQQDSCEIYGIATTPTNVIFYRVVGRNEVGMSSASVIIKISSL